MLVHPERGAVGGVRGGRWLGVTPPQLVGRAGPSAVSQRSTGARHTGHRALLPPPPPPPPPVHSSPPPLHPYRYSKILLFYVALILILSFPRKRLLLKSVLPVGGLFKGLISPTLRSTSHCDGPEASAKRRITLIRSRRLIILCSCHRDVALAARLPTVEEEDEERRAKSPYTAEYDRLVHI